MRLEDRLSVVINERVHHAPQPLPDLAEARMRGRRLRRRRQATGLTAMVVAMVAAAGVVLQAPEYLSSQPEKPAVVGHLDYSEGLRAFASPDDDGEVWIGGRSFPVEDMGYLDTDATATPFGMVFFDSRMQAHLLTEDGTQAALAPVPTEDASTFRPSAKADAQRPLVAFTQPASDGVSVLLRDLQRGRTTSTIDVPCDGAACADVRIEGVDRGLVFVRTGQGTYVWDAAAGGADGLSLLGTGDFRVADVRNGRILWAGAPPAPAPQSPVSDWDFMRGQIDAELSHDGRHILYWSSTLKPVDPEGRSIRLQAKGASWFTFDTDGSVLAAVNHGPDMRSSIYDCELVSGGCERVGSISTRSGDPVFIGNDM